MSRRHWTRREEEVRAEVLRAAGYQCAIRIPGVCIGIANEVDHIHAKAWGGLATRDNLRAACRPCNRAKGTKSAEQVEAFFSNGERSRAPLRKLPPLQRKPRQITPLPVKVRDYTRKADK